jgi:hypothetical protein
MPSLSISRQAKSAIRLLRKHRAPEELISSFRELIQVNFRLESKAPVRDLLFDACKEFNFSGPFSIDGTPRYFRPYLLDRHNPAYFPDCRENQIDIGTVGREQSYRRGYDQGFAEARLMFEEGTSPGQIKQREKEIHAWRTRPVQILSSSPGSDENFDKCFIVPRGSISPRVRYNVFKRDNFRCQICGHSQADGVTLHVDHRTSIADGGEDEIDNLQTLCSDCNLGKSSDSMN